MTWKVTCGLTACTLDQLRAQHSVTSLGERYLYLFKNNNNHICKVPCRKTSVALAEESCSLRESKSLMEWHNLQSVFSHSEWASNCLQCNSLRRSRRKVQSSGKCGRQTEFWWSVCTVMIWKRMKCLEVWWGGWAVTEMMVCHVH